MDNEKIREIVYRAIDQVNEGLSEDEKLVKSPDTYLFGEKGTLDSLGLVNLMVAVEQTINDELGYYIALAQDRVNSQPLSPFESVKSLVDYIGILLKEDSHGTSTTQSK